MPRNDDSFRLYLLRTGAVLLLLVVATVLALNEETSDWKDWSGSARWSVPLLLTFTACYSWVQIIARQGGSGLMHLLVWAAAATLVPLHFSMREMGMLTGFVAFWIAHTPRLYSLRVSSRLAVGAAALHLLMYYLRGDEGLGTMLLLAVLIPACFFFVLTISYTSISLERERQQALDLNRALNAAHLRLAQSSRAGERLRIAREIHDLLGHQMTALILNLEVATHKTNGYGLIQVERALALAKMLLGDLRNAVSDIREHPAMDFDIALAELITDIPGLTVTLDSEEQLSMKDPATAEVVLRCIQEALTNTLRHASATSCHIRLYRQNAELVLEITDDGASLPSITPGNGLTGMQERINALAGSLSWQGGSGFRLQARLPLVETEA
jgi:two-component system, NarL family, sensor histidine kinase DesK